MIDNKKYRNQTKANLGTAKGVTTLNKCMNNFTLVIKLVYHIKYLRNENNQNNERRKKLEKLSRVA